MQDLKQEVHRHAWRGTDWKPFSDEKLLKAPSPKTLMFTMKYVSSGQTLKGSHSSWLAVTPQELDLVQEGRIDCEKHADDLRHFAALTDMDALNEFSLVCSGSADRKSDPLLWFDQPANHTNLCQTQQISCFCTKALNFSGEGRF